MLGGAVIVMLAQAATGMPAFDAEFPSRIAGVESRLFGLLWEDCAPGDLLDAMIAEDMEMYHDRNGASHGRAGARRHRERRCAALAETGRMTRSEVIAGSFRWNPVPGFGAVTTAQRAFYFTDPGKAERMIGTAQVTIVWKWSDARWQAYRLLSLDHEEAPRPQQRAISPSAAHAPTPSPRSSLIGVTR